MHDYWNQWPEVILGAEGDDDVDNPGDEDPSDDDEDAEDPDEGENQDQAPSAEDIAKLQEALNKERRANKKLMRENNRFKASQGQQQQQELGDLEEARNREQAARATAEKLAAGLLKRDIDAAIERAARTEKFLDVEDAINGVDRSMIDFDQDEDDPTDIDIDFETVAAAVKKLATKKPHFISRGTDDGEPSGSAFGGSKKQKKTSEDAYREMYPSL